MGLKLAMLGLDISHVLLFSELLHNKSHEYHIPGASIAAAFPGGLPDDPSPRNRVQGYTRELEEKYDIPMLRTPEETVEQCDAVLLTSGDGRTHPEWFSRICGYGKPVFINKPFALSSQEARSIIEAANEHSCPLMSSSALRFAGSICDIRDDRSGGDIFGADAYSPGDWDDSQPGLFHYGIHAVEMIYTVLGAGCRSVTARSGAKDDVVAAEWKDGRIGTVRTNRRGSERFGLMVHRPELTQHADIWSHPKPMFASLLEAIIAFFKSGKTPVSLDETMEIIRFIEAANESARTGQTVLL